MENTTTTITDRSPSEVFGPDWAFEPAPDTRIGADLYARLAAKQASAKLEGLIADLETARFSNLPYFEARVVTDQIRETGFLALLDPLPSGVLPVGW